MQKLSEIAPFLAVVGHPRTVIEIGAGKGGMLAALCSVATDDATIISIDLEGGPFGGGVSDAELRARANARPGQTLHLVRGILRITSSASASPDSFGTGLTSCSSTAITHMTGSAATSASTPDSSRQARSSLSTIFFLTPAFPSVRSIASGAS